MKKYDLLTIISETGVISGAYPSWWGELKGSSWKLHGAWTAKSLEVFHLHKYT